MQSISSLNLNILLLAHVICADHQIHYKESKELAEIAKQFRVSEETLVELEKIFVQDDQLIPVEDILARISATERIEAFRQVLAIAYVDGYFAPLEREFVDKVAKIWNISNAEITRMCEEAEGFGNLGKNEIYEESDEVSVGAKILDRAQSVLSSKIVNKLYEIAPDSISKKIEKLQQEILLSGGNYEKAITLCNKISLEDLKYSRNSLTWAYQSLQSFGQSLSQPLNNLNSVAKSNQESQKNAKEIKDKLDKTRNDLFCKILHDIENVRQVLKAKERTSQFFTISFMGQTKAGKSTLHSIITKQGWESIGSGKQRTTRYNRVYDWKNIRIVDTPGIGAPGGKTDEEIAESIIDETDVICFVVRDNNIKESEFKVLRNLKDRCKPVIILLNISENLCDSRRLDKFLGDSQKFFDKKDIPGHIARIKNYAKKYYPNASIPVFPVMLLAAQLSQQEEDKERSKKLFDESRISEFLNSLRISIIDHGSIRRSQNLLGSTVGSIITPNQWISQQHQEYELLGETLQSKSDALIKNLNQIQQDKLSDLNIKIKRVFEDINQEVNIFAEKYWNKNEKDMLNGWEKVLKKQRFSERIENSCKETYLDYQHEASEALEELGRELKILSEFQQSNFQFSEQDSGFPHREVLEYMGLTLVVVGSLSFLVFPPLAIVGIVGTAIGLLAKFFESTGERKRKAVKNISDSLSQQLKEQEVEITQKVTNEFLNYSRNIIDNIEYYFQKLIQGIDDITGNMQTTEKELTRAIDYLNKAYAKRIVDWSTGNQEPLNDMIIRQSIKDVIRDFGISIDITTNQELNFIDSPEALSKILQEKLRFFA